MRTALAVVSVACLGAGGTAIALSFTATSDVNVTAAGFLLLLAGVVGAITTSQEYDDKRREDG